MNPIKFDECNTFFGPNTEMEDVKCEITPAWVGDAEGGSLDGLRMAVCAYKLDEHELKEILEGGYIYVTMVGGLSMHYMSTNFHDATHPS
jgi:hypothetical protein